MTDRRLVLAEQRGALRARIALQRAELAANLWPVRSALGAGDTAVDAVHWLKGHPAAVFASVAALIAARPKRVVRWARRGYFLWRSLRSLKRSVTGEG